MSSMTNKDFIPDSIRHIMLIQPSGRVSWVIVGAVMFTVASPLARQTAAPLPSSSLQYGAFKIRFAPDGAFTLQGQGWPTFAGTWKSERDELTVVTTGGPPACSGPGRYRFQIDRTRVTLAVVADECTPRRMILNASTWRPEGEAATAAERRIVRTGAARPAALPKPAPAKGSWPSFRGPNASGVADGQQLPDRWDAKTGENILWRTPIPGLAHSSPIVWGDRVFVTSAISSKAGATFKPGLYGDGDASDDRSPHKWVLYAIDKRTGKIAWERVAASGEPRNKRHIKSTYASASPATDGRIVVAWFGSQGVHAYDVNGTPLWQVDLGRVDMGAYDIPVVRVGARQLADHLERPGAAAVRYADRLVPSRARRSDGQDGVEDRPAGDPVVGNAHRHHDRRRRRAGDQRVELHPRLRSAHRQGVVAARRQLQDHRADADSSPTGLIVVASGRGPERPIFVVRPGARGDLTLPKDQTSSAAVAWSKTGRGSYMPTPLAYDGILYVLANNGVFDAYDLQTGQEIYRQRLEPVGSGFSASPVAADGRIYLSSEDGEIIVISAGREFKKIACELDGRAGDGDARSLRWRHVRALRVPPVRGREAKELSQLPTCSEPGQLLGSCAPATPLLGLRRPRAREERFGGLYKLYEIERFLQHEVGELLALTRLGAGDDDDRYRLQGTLCAEVLEKIPAAGLRHQQIRDDEARPTCTVVVEDLECAFDAVGGADLEATELESARKQVQRLGIVVDDEHERTGSTGG